MTDQSFYSLNQYLKERFHEKVYKLALHGGETCPNRDGLTGHGGCIFCGEGSGSFASETIDEAIGRLSQKQIGSRYIAYFQSYTATYRMTKQLVSRMLEAAEDERIAAVSIGTRPDCLEADVMELLLNWYRRSLSGWSWDFRRSTLQLQRLSEEDMICRPLKRQ